MIEGKLHKLSYYDSFQVENDVINPQWLVYVKSSRIADGKIGSAGT